MLPIPQLQKNERLAPTALKLLWLECASALLAHAPLPSSIAFHEPKHRCDSAGHAKALLTGKITALDCINNAFHVRDLVSPIGKYAAALIRLNDTDRIDIDGKSSGLLANLCQISQSQCNDEFQFRALVPSPSNRQALQDLNHEKNPFDEGVERYWSQRYGIFSALMICTDREGLFCLNVFGIRLV